MPTTPRAAVIGLGSAVGLLIGVPLIAGIIATFAVRDRQHRAEEFARFEQVMADIRQFGVDNERFPIPADDEFWAALGGDVVVVEGEYTVSHGGHPAHCLPAPIVAVLQSRLVRDSATIPVTAFDVDGTVSDVLGSSNGIGIFVGFTDGEVYILRDDTPLREIRPFLARDTAVQADRKRLIPHRLRP